MKITRHIPFGALSLIARLFCKHQSIRVEEKQVVCNNCHSSWPISKALTEPSGVYARIQERMEQTEELMQLVERAEQYQRAGGLRYEK